MPPRAYWKGHVRFSLISIPIRLYTATDSSSKISFNQIHRDSRQRVHYQPMAGDQPIPRSQIAKGYEYEKDTYVIVEPDELKNLKAPTSKVIDIVQFIDASQLDLLHVDRPYYMGPDGRVAMEPFCVMREAMHRARKIAIGQVTLSSREHLIAITPRGRGFLMVTLRYAQEVRPAESHFDDVEDIKIDQDKQALAEQLIDSMTRPMDWSRFEDRYEQQLVELVQVKMRGQEPVVVAQEPEPQTIDFMQALRESLQQKGQQADQGQASGSARRRTSGRRKKAG